MDSAGHIRNRACRRSGAAALPLALLAAGLAQAGDPMPDGVPAASLETVEVTAQKRREPLQDVPLAVDVVAGDRLSDRAIGSLSGLQRLVPSLQIADNTSIQTIYLRGVGGGGRNVGFDTRTGVFLDGVYIGTPPAADLMLLDLQRVEVLRGPQGDLYGQNTVSGAIHLVTQPPSETFGAQFLAAAGNLDSLRSAASADLPLSRRAQLRLSGSWQARDGYIDNLTNTREVGDLEDGAARAQLRLSPRKNLRIDLAADHAEQRSDKVGGEARSGPFGQAMPLPPSLAAPLVADDNLAERNRYENQGLAATIDLDFANRRLSSISAWRESLREWRADVDHSALDILGLDYRDRYETLSQEFRLAGHAAGTRDRYLLGLYLSATEAGSERQLFGGAQSDLIGLDPSVPQALGSLARVDTEVYAVFGSYDYSPSPKLRLHAGVRLAHMRKRLEIDQSSEGQAGAVFGTAELDDYGDSREETALMPTLSLSWDARADTTLYTRYARGSKAGGYNADFITQGMLATGIEFDDETVDSYELGYKAILLGDRLLLDLAMFLAEYRDYQVSQFVPVPGSDPPTITPSLTNAGKVRSYGPELNLSAVPLPRLQMDLALAWLHSEYASFESGDGNGRDYSGNDTEYAPEFSASLSAEYAITLPAFGGSQCYLQPAWSYRGDHYSNPANGAAFSVDSYQLFDARIGLRAVNLRWDVSLYGQNLTDERYDLGTSRDALTTLYGPYGLPRTYGVELRYRWR